MRGYGGFLYARWNDEWYSYDLLKKIETEDMQIKNEYDDM